MSMFYARFSLRELNTQRNFASVLDHGLRMRVTYRLITNDVSDYINLLVRIAHIICNHPSYNTLISVK